MCEKALSEYLETKRLAFPRFYFVSSADLLDILSNGNNPPMVGEKKRPGLSFFFLSWGFRVRVGGLESGFAKWVFRFFGIWSFGFRVKKEKMSLWKNKGKFV